MARRDAVLRASMTAIAMAAVAVPAWVVTHAPALRSDRKVVLRLPHHVVPPAVLPEVEPTKLVDLSPDEARSYNASVPFFDGPNPAARPFRYAGGTDDLGKATDCLAAAAVYEAGDDALGERAVAQVVLNRLRHPAFPKTVCGVVFQGEERATGCQFTFTCDGALTRWKPSADAWRRAREVATMALAGSVYKPVGYATHYHTEWVVPYWQSSLDKIAAVHTHLFFRWSGWWGTPPAFNRQLQPGEPLEPKIAALSDAHNLGAALAQSDAAIAAAAPFMGRKLMPLASDPNTFLTALDPAQPPESYAALAAEACGERPTCKVMGWTNVGAMAFTVPLSPDQIAALSFSYLRDKPTGMEKALWNCAEFKMPVGSCMKRQLLRAMPADAVPPPGAVDPAAAAPAPAGKLAPAELGGVHRKTGSEPTPAPSPTPTPTPHPTATPAGR